MLISYIYYHIAVVTKAPESSTVILHLVPFADFNTKPLLKSVISISVDADAPTFVTADKEGVAVVIVLGFVQLPNPVESEVSIQFIPGLFVILI